MISRPYQPPRANWPTATGQTVTPSNPTQAYDRLEPTSTSRYPRSSTGSNYFEDVDPRFADHGEDVLVDTRVPSALLPGPAGEPQLMEPMEDVPEGARSPAASETSHYTSISERPVNPRWRPPPPPFQQRTDILLENNPDFELRPPRAGRGAIGAGGRLLPSPISREPSRNPLS